MRLRTAMLALVAACSSSPRPGPPTPVEIATVPADTTPVVVDAAAVDAPPADAFVATAAPVAVDAPVADETDDATPLRSRHWGPPPKPPQSMRWSFHVPAFGKHGSTSESLEVDEEGFGSYDRRGSGTSERGPVDPGPAIRCSGRVAPKQHAALVAAARKLVTVACERRQAPRRGMPSLSMTYAYGKATKSCRVDRDHATYPRYARIHDQIVDELCKKP